jgi:hypothetical protein
MCLCFYALKGTRESSSPDALWAYDPGKGSTSSSRWAQHAIGPAPSGQSCIGLRDVSNTLGRVFDRDGYITSTFSLTNLATADPVSAWNGTDTAWFLATATGGTTNWYAFNLSGTQLSSSRYDSGSRFRAACNSSGDLIAYNASTSPQRMERRARGGTVSASSSSVPSSVLCVDASDNILTAQASSLVKYNGSFTQQWSTSYSQFGASVLAVVADSSSNAYVLYAQSPPGTAVKIEKYNSSGTSQSVTTITTFNGLYDQFVDFWCDGTNLYLAFFRNVGLGTMGLTVIKYNGSVSEVWARNPWYEDGTANRTAKSVRSDGTVLTLAGVRGQ